MDKLHDYLQIFWLIPPGILVLALAVEALIVTLIPTRCLEKKGVKPLAVIICFALAVGEGALIRHDRDEAAKQHKADVEALFARFVKVDQDVIAVQQNLQAQHVESRVSTDTLRKRALDLSSEILQFLIRREVPPGFGQGGLGEGPYGGKATDAASYDRETVQAYLSAFEPRVSQIREELKRRGLTDQELDQECGNTVNTYSIRAIAERLTTLAERLPS